jgi:hypothetical protein
MGEINELEARMFRESYQIKEECYKLAWFMRGSLSVTEAMMMSHDDREIIGIIIKENLETTKKTGLNFF